MADEMGGTGGEPGEGGATAADKQVVTDEINWRARALQAEGKLAELEKALADLRATLEQTREALAANERRRGVELAVSAAGAIDVDVAVMMVEAAMKDRGPEELDAVIDEMQRSKPFLFEQRRSATGGAGVMSPETSRGGEALATLADEARASGDRRALLRYLQARRGNQ